MSSAATYLDRDGTERAAEAAEHDPLCDGRGWLITSTPDLLVACLDCRPHLRTRLRRRGANPCSG